MAKKSVIERQKKRLPIYKKYFLIRKFVKGKILNSSTLDEKLFYQSILERLPKNSSISRLLW